MKAYIKKFSEITLNDVDTVGTKSAYLGNTFKHLIAKHLLVPDGFAVTIAAFKYFTASNQISERLSNLVDSIDLVNFSNLKSVGAQARKLIMDAQFPDDLLQEITLAYDELCEGQPDGVTVRSSVVADDLQEAFFADHYGIFYNINGYYGLLHTIKQCFASLFDDKAIKYRKKNKVDERKAALSVCVHQMVRADLASSGTCYSHLTGAPGLDLIVLTGSYGLTENPERKVNFKPDEFKILKESVQGGKIPVIHKTLGNKDHMMVYEDNEDEASFTKIINTPASLAGHFVLTDDEVVKLAHWALTLENYYQVPVSFKWAKDGINHQLFLTEARPETILHPVSIY